MRTFFTSVLALAAVAVLATSGLALEKTAARFDETRADYWSQDYTCTIGYYNTCTGWIWCWGGFSPNDMFGTCFAGPCCGPDATGSSLAVSWTYFCTGSPTGYNFTGSVDIWSGDAMCCPTGLLFSQPMLPVSGWNAAAWGVQVPSPFIVAWVNGPTAGNPGGFTTDHPAAGPTGPQACGYCYPSPRTTFSFYYGTPTTILCPGSALDDGICFCELVFDVAFDCVVGVDESSWGAIKGLYH